MSRRLAQDIGADPSTAQWAMVTRAAVLDAFIEEHLRAAKELLLAKHNAGKKGSDFNRPLITRRAAWSDARLRRLEISACLTREPNGRTPCSAPAERPGPLAPSRGPGLAQRTVVAARYANCTLPNCLTVRRLAVAPCCHTQ